MVRGVSRDALHVGDAGIPASHIYRSFIAFPVLCSDVGTKILKKVRDDPLRTLGGTHESRNRSQELLGASQYQSSESQP